MSSNIHYKTHGSRWFRRLIKDIRKISQHIRVKRIRFGFYRIYYKQCYIHELYSEMPQKGYDIDDLDPRFESKKYYEEYEDNAELTRKIKNFVEGYWDSLDKIRTRCYLLKHNKDYYDSAKRAYSNMVVK